MLMSGKKFKEKNIGERFYKLTNFYEYHNGFQFEDGINVDTVEFNPTKGCNLGGIYFTKYEDIGKWISYGSKENLIMYWAREVFIFDESEIFIEKFKRYDEYGIVVTDYIYKTDCIYLKEREVLWENNEMCEMAVKYDGYCLEQVVNQTPKICIMAVTQNQDAIKMIVSDEMKKLVKTNLSIE